MTGASVLDTGSFRDRTSRVFYSDGEVRRAVNAEVLGYFRQLQASTFFPQAVAAGKVVRTEEIRSGEAVPANDGDPWAGVLAHERVPFLSYAYEWSFGMLRDAALLQLELLSSALQEDFVLKDASTYNVQFRGARPIFIDIGSFERLKPGEPWIGYRQFCQMFLYPLLLQAYRGVPFQGWMRGSLEGIDVSDMAGLFSSWRDLIRPGIFKHVYLHSKLQTTQLSKVRNVRSEMQSIGFHKELILANLKGLTRLIKKLSLKGHDSVWAEYASNNSYSDADTELKKAFIAKIVSTRHRSLVWDIGANTGTFSRIAAANSETVLAIDSDWQAVDLMYRSLKESGPDNILPLVMNLANPSPAHGWRGDERKNLTSRGKPDLVLALALIHHIVISANIPLSEFIEWLAGITKELVIEFVTREDPMVKTLLLNKEDTYRDYDQDYFEQCLSKHFQILERTRLGSGTRELYHCVA